MKFHLYSSMPKNLRSLSNFATYHWDHLCALAQYAAFRRSAPEGRFIIFGRGRSGSTALVNLLNKIPGVQCDGEVLRYKVLHPGIQIRAMASRSKERYYGCKVLSYHLRSIQRIQDATKFLRELHYDGYKVIYLKRANPLRHAVSTLCAPSFGFHQKKHSSRRPGGSIRIDPLKLVERIEGSTSLDAYERSALGDIPCLPLFYEDDLQRESDHQRTVDRVCQFLDIAPAPVTCDYRKLTPRRLRDLIANYTEVERHIRATPYYVYLDDPE